MNRIAFADKTGIFAWSDVQNCRDTLPQRDAASRFMALVFSKFNTDAISLNGRMTGATAQCSETSRQSCRTAWTTNVIWSGCRRMENGCCCVFQSICENVRFF